MNSFQEESRVVDDEFDISIVRPDYDLPPQYPPNGGPPDLLLVYRKGDVFCLTLEPADVGPGQHLRNAETEWIWVAVVETSYQEWRNIGSGRTLYEALEVVSKYIPPQD